MIRTGHLYYVHGTRGKDLTELKASVAYKYTAITHEPRIQERHNDWQRWGYKQPQYAILDTRRIGRMSRTYKHG